ncbi:hypothetical protein D3C78_1736450 [compost metagenome]
METIGFHGTQPQVRHTERDCLHRRERNQHLVPIRPPIRGWSQAGGLATCHVSRAQLAAVNLNHMMRDFQLLADGP